MFVSSISADRTLRPRVLSFMPVIHDGRRCESSHILLFSGSNASPGSWYHKIEDTYHPHTSSLKRSSPKSEKTGVGKFAIEVDSLVFRARDFVTQRKQHEWVNGSIGFVGPKL